MSVDTVEAPAPAGGDTKSKKYVKPSTVDILFGHCRSGVVETLPDGRVRHPHCPGSGENGLGSTAFCTCDCHISVPVCRYCRQIDVELTLEGYCVDQEGCEGAMARKQAANPVWRMLQEIIREAKYREADEQRRRADERRQRRERETQEAVATGRPAPVRAQRVPKAPPTPQRCHCGCGGMTKGGKFVAGHDARLKGMLVKAARQTPPETGPPATVAEATRAMAELIARGWPRKHVTPLVTERAEAMVDEYGLDRIVEAAVAARYGPR